MVSLRALGTGAPQGLQECGALRLRRASSAAAGPSRAQVPCWQPHAAACSSRCRQGPAAQLTRRHAMAPSDCDAAPGAEPQPVWQQLERLYASDHFPLSAPGPWRAGLPAAIDSGTLQHLLRPVGGLLQLAVKLEESPSSLKQQEEERRKRQDYYANVGDAIRTLREEIPLLFWHDLTYDIYRDDVVFKDPRNTLRGKKNYQRLFKGLRLFGRVCFMRVRMDVLRIWQPESNRINLRWKFHGVPRIPWEVEGVFEGVSQFKLDSEGKIYEHSVDNIILRDPPLGISPLWNSLNRIFSPQPQPCPGINFGDLPEGQGPLSPVPLAARKHWAVLPQRLPPRHQGPCGNI